jgi:antitoxin CcdA
MSANMVLASSPRQSAPSSRPGRRATNVTLPEALIQEAKVLGIDLSHAFEQGLAAAVAEARAAAWLTENRPEIDVWNEHVERHGIPLAEFRRF